MTRRYDQEMGISIANRQAERREAVVGEVEGEASISVNGRRWRSADIERPINCNVNL